MEDNKVITSNEEVEAGADAASEEEVKTYTQEEVLKLLQSEADKRVSQALAKQKKKYEKELSLSKLDDEARARAEKDNRIAELEEQLAAYQVEKNRSELKSVLASRGLSAEFADIVFIGNDIEEAQANIDKLDNLFKAAVKSEVEKRLASNAPRGNGNTAGIELTREAAKKMSIAEMQKLQKTNPSLYNKFFG